MEPHIGLCHFFQSFSCYLIGLWYKEFFLCFIWSYDIHVYAYWLNSKDKNMINFQIPISFLKVCCSLFPLKTKSFAETKRFTGHISPLSSAKFYNTWKSWSKMNSCTDAISKVIFIYSISFLASHSLHLTIVTIKPKHLILYSNFFLSLVRLEWSKAKYFPLQPAVTQSISTSLL